jgi:hypothetical protein
MTSMVLRDSTLESLTPSVNAPVDISLTGQIKLKAKTTSYSEPAAPTSTRCRMDDLWTGNYFFIIFLSHIAIHSVSIYLVAVKCLTYLPT